MTNTLRADLAKTRDRIDGKGRSCRINKRGCIVSVDDGTPEGAYREKSCLGCSCRSSMRPISENLPVVEAALFKVGLFLIISAYGPDNYLIEWYQEQPVEEPIGRSWDVHNPGTHPGKVEQTARALAAVEAAEKVGL